MLSMNPAMNAPLELVKAISGACAKVPPLWPLDSFVAVNPFVGLNGMKFLEAHELLKRTRHTEILLPAKEFSERCAAGEIREADFVEAKSSLMSALSEEEAKVVGDWRFADWRLLLTKAGEAKESGAGLLTFADHCDAQLMTNWNSFIIDEVSKWCSSYYDQGQSVWGFPFQQKSLWEAFRSVAQGDLNPEMMGLVGFRQVLQTLPAGVELLIGEALKRLNVHPAMSEEFLLRELMTVAGWSSYVQHEVNKSSLAGQTNRSLVELLAIRLSYDVALHAMYADNVELLRTWKEQLLQPSQEAENHGHQLARLLGHHALEAAYQRNLLAKLSSNKGKSTTVSVRPEVQAVFCIDVRSEVLRRHLEQQSAGIETIGFAGFFGLPVEHLKAGESAGKAQCPVLLTPKYRAVELFPTESDKRGLKLQKQRAFRQAWDSFRLSAVSCFGYVEVCGLGTVLSLAKDSLKLGKKSGSEPGELKLTRQSGSCGEHAEIAEIEISEQITLAANMLKNMGLRSNFARLVLICGHGSQTQNNPYGSALDCGACGGQAGDVNARLAAKLLNRAEVRAGLADHGFQIPLDTVFLAGLHNTTTDEVQLFDLSAVPASHQGYVAELQVCLERAGVAASRERERLAAGARAEMGGSEAAQRAKDWSQVRPEWGLAGNAAFIAAPRELTRGASLDGRVFLHNYECEADKDDSVLELILTAPVVVASWINLQYYASRVDNVTFGSGNKAIHNVVGTLGIWQGNAGDLQAGLPLQSLHNGERWMHEPLRLSVFIRAKQESISKILKKHPTVENLFANGWLHLLAMEPKGEAVTRYQGQGRWSGCATEVLEFAH